MLEFFVPDRSLKINRTFAARYVQARPLLLDALHIPAVHRCQRMQLCKQDLKTEDGCIP